MRYLLEEGYDNAGKRPENEVLSWYGPRAWSDLQAAYSWFSAVLFLFLCEWVRSMAIWRNSSAHVLEECRTLLLDWLTRHGEERTRGETTIARLYDLWESAGYPPLVGSEEDMAQRRSFFWSKGLEQALSDSALFGSLLTISASVDGNMAFLREGPVYTKADRLTRTLVDPR
jgi:hypothetical protein